MTNEQVAAARRAFRAFPDVTPHKNGDVITPVHNGEPGDSVTVTDTMGEGEVTRQLTAKIEALLG